MHAASLTQVGAHLLCRGDIRSDQGRCTPEGMPLTFPAHQGLIVPLKLRWPRWFDATALCIGSAAPDFAYSFDRYIGYRSHSVLGLLLWAVPFTLVAAAVTRRWAAAGIFAVGPDLGPLRLRSYRVLGLRRPAPLVTLSSALLAAGSHMVVDSFTHNHRWGANLLSVNEVVLTAPIKGPMTGADLLQYAGHAVGSLLFAVFIVVVSLGGRLERWYGADAVARARTVVVSGRDRAVFATIVAVPVAVSIVWPWVVWGRARFEPLTALAVSLLVAGTVIGRRHPIAPEPKRRAEPVGPSRRPE